MKKAQGEKKTRRARKTALPTPGPYAITEAGGGNGFTVLGKSDITVGWFATNATFSCEENNCHSISIDEARANAELFVQALRKQYGPRRKKP
jgi:hypothetical protein